LIFNVIYFQAISAYFIKDTAADTTFLHEKLNWEYRNSLSNSGAEEEIWEFGFEIDEPGPVFCRTQFLEVLPTYTITMIIDDFQTELNENELVTFIADTGGTYQGTITITNGLRFNNDVNSQPDFSNYPNPFNPETTFKFSLLEDSAVSLKIYNIKGQSVYTICDNFLPEGNYEFVWSGIDHNREKIASGIYFVRYKSNSKDHVSKLVLLK